MASFVEMKKRKHELEEESESLSPGGKSLKVFAENALRENCVKINTDLKEELKDFDLLSSQKTVGSDQSKDERTEHEILNEAVKLLSYGKYSPGFQVKIPGVACMTADTSINISTTIS
uniref:Uncharacterized protein n=1 Tax=Magallana gigas TaxID=29159 RepID=K1QFB7_MAGGI